MAWLVVGASDGASVSKDFKPPLDRDLDISIRARHRALTPEERASFPRDLYVGKPTIDKMPEIIGWSIGPFYLNQQLRDIIEDLEPRRHDFLPIHVKTERPFKGATDHGTYFIVVSPLEVDAVVIEETNFFGGFGRSGYEKTIELSAPARNGVGVAIMKNKITLRRSAIAGRHLWRLPAVFESHYIVSDALRDTVKSKKMRGWDFSLHCDEID